MSRFTPGPWHLMVPESLKLEANGFTVVADTARHAIRGIYEPQKSEVDNATAHALDEANARLIASAPEMLDALLFLLQTFEELGAPSNLVGVVAAKKAIAKATGGA